MRTYCIQLQREELASILYGDLNGKETKNEGCVYTFS